MYRMFTLAGRAKQCGLGMWLSKRRTAPVIKAEVKFKNFLGIWLSKRRTAPAIKAAVTNRGTCQALRFGPGNMAVISRNSPIKNAYKQ